MECRFQHILLKSLAMSLGLMGLQSAVFAEKLDLDNEYFEFGVSSGFINIQDFRSEPSLGLHATFTGSQNLFVQFNYITAEASLSSFEESQGAYFTGDDRDYIHYDILLGYKIFQGEIFWDDNQASLSSLYAVVGVGNNTFGGEEVLSQTLGLGYKIGLTRKINLNLDYRSYTYESSILTGDESKRYYNGHFIIGIGYLW